MAGTIIPVIEKTEFDFSNLAESSTQTIPMIKALDVMRWSEATLVLRVHTNSTSGEGGGTLGVRLEEILPSAEEPQTDFIGTSAAEILFGNGQAAPSLLMVTPSWDLSHLRVLVKGSQGSPVTATLKAEISADLILKAKQ